MLTRNCWIAALALVFIAGFGETSYGQQHHHNGNAAPPPAKAPPAPPPASRPSVPSQLSADESAERAAAAELATDQQNLKAITDAAQAKFEQTPEWVAAQQKVASAQADLETAKKTAQDTMTNSADYQAAVAAKKKAADDLAAAKASGDATPEVLSPLATASLQASIALRQMESGVLTNDAGVQAATENVAAVQHEADLLKMKFQQQLPLNRAYVASKATADSAQKRYEDAHARVVADVGGN
jgi:hypothetical protein